MNDIINEVDRMTNEQYKIQALAMIRTLQIIAETQNKETILEVLKTIEETIKKPQ